MENLWAARLKIQSGQWECIPKHTAEGVEGPRCREKLGETGRRELCVPLGTSPASGGNHEVQLAQLREAAPAVRAAKMWERRGCTVWFDHSGSGNVLSWRKSTRMKCNCWSCTGQPQESPQVPLPGINLRQGEQGEQETQAGKVSFRAPSAQQTQARGCNCINRSMFHGKLHPSRGLSPGTNVCGEQGNTAWCSEHRKCREKGSCTFN